MFRIQSLTALEILDSRGRPTVRTTCQLDDGAVGTAAVPSGASTGTAEALELRDGDPLRYRGLGCRRAVAQVNGPILDAVRGRPFEHQSELDEALCTLDGTPNKRRLGANAILSVSLAVARAVAIQNRQPLHARFALDAGRDPAERQLPRPTINLFSGGKHAGGQAPIQDILLVPASAKTMDEALSMTAAVYAAAADLCATRYGMRLLRADEGGLAPPFTCADAMLEDAVTAIRAAGFAPGRDICLAVDVASSHFHQSGRYALDGRALTSEEMIDTLDRWTGTHPVVSVEDGLAEEDWAHWPGLVRRLSGRALVVGDDFLCTNPTRIRRAIDARAANALLLKVNQIGTLTEAFEAWRLARAAGWQVTVSARSGETEDDWLADLAAGLGAGQIKIGSITQSERLAKYNRLLALEAEGGWHLASWPGSQPA